MAQTADLPLIQFIGAVLELVLYGVYVVLFVGTVWVLRKWRQGARARVSPFIDICSWFVFLTLTAHCAGTIWFTYYGYVILGTDPAGQLVFLADEGSNAALLREGMYGLSALGTEMMLIYRLYIVWSRAGGVIVLPCALVAVDFAGFALSMYGSTHNALPVLARATAAWIEPALFIGEASTNLLCSVLMAVRIVQNAGPGVGPVLWIVAESAIVYTALTAVVAAKLMMHDPLLLAFVAVLLPIAGITSCLLLVRVGLDMAAHSAAPAHQMSPVRSRDGTRVGADVESEGGHKAEGYGAADPFAR